MRRGHYLAETRTRLRDRSSWRTESTRRPRQAAVAPKAERPAGARRAARPSGRSLKKASAAEEHPLAALAAMGDGRICARARGRGRGVGGAGEPCSPLPLPLLRPGVLAIREEGAVPTRVEGGRRGCCCGGLGPGLS